MSSKCREAKQLLEDLSKQAPALGLELHHCEMRGQPETEYVLLVDEIHFTMFVVPDLTTFKDQHQDTMDRSYPPLSPFGAMVDVMSKRYQVCRFLRRPTTSEAILPS